MQHDGPVGLDGVRVKFDDERAVADAGIVLVATLAARLGVEALAGRLVRLGRRGAAANAGRKVMSLIYVMVLGADSIDDCDVLRSGRLGTVAAPSTLGTFLRAFTFGHVRQLDRLLAETRAWRAGAGPGSGRLVVDVDSFVGEVFGYGKQGAAFAWPRRGRGGPAPVPVRGGWSSTSTHSLARSSATASRARRSGTRARPATTQSSPRAPRPARCCTSGCARARRTRSAGSRFWDELIARVKRAGAIGPKLLRADSGFWNAKVFERLERAGWRFSIGVRMTAAVRDAVEQINRRGAWELGTGVRRRDGMWHHELRYPTLR